jgi:hypothetical protein
LAQHFANMVEAQIQATNEDTLQVVRSLTPLQSAVLRVLAANGKNYAPFEARTLESYKAAMADPQMQTEVNLETSSVQQALVALQEKGLVWRASRGVYALEDSALASLLADGGDTAKSTIKTPTSMP